MSEFYSLLRASIEQNATGVFRAIRPDFALPDEVSASEFVRSFFQRHGQLPTLQTVVSSGFNLTPATEPASYYLQRVRERYAYNQMSGPFRDMHNAFHRRDMPVVVNLMRDCVHNVASTLSPQSYASIGQVAESVRTEFLEARAEIGTLRGITLGYPTADEILGGARAGDLIVVAGRPGMGKSYVMLQMANAAWDARKSVAFVTMEMGTEEIGIRWASLRTGINPEWISRGELDVWGESLLMQALETMRLRGTACPLHFLAGDFNKNVRGVEEFVLEHSPDILFVDAAYLLTASGKANGYISKWENISEVVGELKRIALRYNIPVVISVQFNRNVKNSQQTDLDLGDVAGSDSIPQDATAVFGIRQGPPPFEWTRRIIQTLKARRGHAKDWQIRFSFNRVNFEECSEQEIATTDLGFMI